MLKGFRDFLMRGNVVDLAVAVVIGAAFGDVVKALTEDLITPLIGIVGGVPDFSALKLGPLLVGNFLNAFLSFVIVAAVIYFFVMIPMNKIMAKVGPKKNPAAPTRACQFCKSTIDKEATRCPYCTSQLQ